VSEVTREDRGQASPPARPYPPSGMRSSEPVNLADLLERVLDKGIVIAGDVRLYLGGIELLTLKIRLLIASVDKAQEIGINWWESDPALSSQNRELRQQRDELLRRLENIEANVPGLEVEQSEEWGRSEPALSAQNRELRQQRDELQERLDRMEVRLAEYEKQEADESKASGSQRGRKRS
jgi:chromosome segregation ATPase